MILNQQELPKFYIALTGCLLLYSLSFVLPHPLLLIIVAFIPLGIMMVLRLSLIMVLLFITFSFFRIHEVLPFLRPLKLPLLLALASLFVFFVRLFLFKDIKIKWPLELTLFSVFVFIICVGILFAGNKSEAVKYFKEIYIKIYIITLIGFWMLEKPKQFKTLLILILGSGFLLSIVAIMNKMNGVGLVEGSRVTIGRNIGSSLGDPNDLSLVLLFPLSYALSQFIHTKKKFQKNIALIIVCLLVTSIIFTQSRGGLLGVTGVFLCFGFQHIRSKTVLLALTFMILSVLGLIAGVSDRGTTQAVDGQLDASAMGRIHAWETAILMALSNPFFGVGLENYYYNYFYYTTHWDGLNHVVHSTWFSVLAETGFVGFFVFICLIFCMFKKAIAINSCIPEKSSETVFIISKATMPALVGFCISGTFLSQSFTWPLYLQLIIILALYRYLNNNKQTKHCNSPLQNAKAI